jgi:hypothetical protein
MISEDNYYKQVGNLVLTDYQMDILNKNGIDVTKFKSNHELIYYLENILNSSSNDELENVSLELSEMYYYNNVNK